MADLTSDKQKVYCSYYQANIDRPNVCFFAGVLRSFEHVAFDRTIDKQTSLFEFFVPQDMENYFLQIMDYCQAQSIVTNLKKLPNRLLDLREDI